MWEDKPDELTAQIESDYGSEGFYARYGRAMELVKNRKPKAELVRLIAFLLKDSGHDLSV